VADRNEIFDTVLHLAALVAAFAAGAAAASMYFMFTIAEAH
jgi:hypothetical protein